MERTYKCTGTLFDENPFRTYLEMSDKTCDCWECASDIVVLLSFGSSVERIMLTFVLDDDEKAVTDLESKRALDRSVAKGTMTDAFAEKVIKTIAEAKAVDDDDGVGGDGGGGVVNDGVDNDLVTNEAERTIVNRALAEQSLVTYKMEFFIETADRWPAIGTIIPRPETWYNVNDSLCFNDWVMPSSVDEHELGEHGNIWIFAIEAL